MVKSFNATDVAQLAESFTWKDYRAWPDETRWELLGGTAIAMSPSPGVRHQALATRIGGVFSGFFKGKNCRPFVAPLDVKLSEHDVVQPDLLVVCDPAQIKDTHIEGAPTLVVEIVSPSSEKQDRLAKMKLYERFGIKEYWIVTPYPPLLEIHTLESGRLSLHSGGSLGEKISSPTFPHLEIDLTEVFDLPFTEEERKIFVVKEPPAKYA